MDLLADRLDRVSYLVRTPNASAAGTLAPVLCFLHGNGEAAPMPVRWALQRHGPLRPGAAALAESFLVIAPQLPHAGDAWNRFGAVVREIVLDARARFGGDPRRTYLTGFSFGANGVFDLARAQPELWTALWAVDPTRVPGRRRLEAPVWVTIGGAARWQEAQFVEALELAPAAGADSGDRAFEDSGDDHVGAATRAYAESTVYQWLLRRQRDQLLFPEPAKRRVARAR